ncbi:VanZ family protein [Pontiella desulfatans]|uniref:VanZ family protein n=1 Tax=Pontiella desulfatans TaxID=2750659 RepID=UPI00109D32F5|nr:VanZ family protein [Pontiella desulfatans]
MRIRLPAMLLLAATLLFWGLYDRYALDGDVLLESPALADATRVRGDCTGTNGHFRLTVHEDGKMASINFRLPGASDFRMIRVRCRIRTADVVPGKYSWRCARLLLTQYDANNKWIPGQHGLVSQWGTGEWSFHQEVFATIPGAAHADVVIQQSGISGTAEFDSIAAEPVRLKKTFFVWQGVFAFLWVGMAGLYYRRCRLHNRRLRLLILLNIFAILFGTLMPTVVIQKGTDGLKESVAKAIQKRSQSKPAAAPETTIKKKPVDHDVHETKRIDRFNEAVDGAHVAGHFVLFSSLCFLVYLSAALEGQHRSYYFKVAFDILLFAAITESMQNLTLDRTAGLSDWLTDVYGMALAFGVFLVVRFFMRNVLKRH